MWFLRLFDEWMAVEATCIKHGIRTLTERHEFAVGVPVDLDRASKRLTADVYRWSRRLRNSDVGRSIAQTANLAGEAQLQQASQPQFVTVDVLEHHLASIEASYVIARASIVLSLRP